VLAVSVLTMVLSAFAWSFAAADPAYTIKEVMNMAHGGGPNSLYAKVASGKASKEDKDQLVDLYSALPGNTPSKGSEKSWKQKTNTLLEAAKAVAENKNGAASKLKSANNCQSCHSAHRGK
jgi:hypothetical protein